MSRHIQHTRRLVAFASLIVIGLTGCQTDPVGPAEAEGIDLLTFDPSPRPINPTPKTFAVELYRNTLQLANGITTDCIWLDGHVTYTWSGVAGSVSVRLESRPRGGTTPTEFRDLRPASAQWDWRNGYYGEVSTRLTGLDPNRQYRLRLVEQANFPPRIGYSDWFRRADGGYLQDGFGYVEYCSEWN